MTGNWIRNKSKPFRQTLDRLDGLKTVSSSGSRGESQTWNWPAGISKGVKTRRPGTLCSPTICCGTIAWCYRKTRLVRPRNHAWASNRHACVRDREYRRRPPLRKTPKSAQTRGQKEIGAGKKEGGKEAVGKRQSARSRSEEINAGTKRKDEAIADQRVSSDFAGRSSPRRVWA